jgi:hypothetical protein
VHGAQQGDRGGKLTVRVVDWRKLVKNTLRGFASVVIVEMRTRIDEIAIHTKSWAQAPARPWVHNGVLVHDDNGKIKYTPPLISFASNKVRYAFDDAVIRALLEAHPQALDDEVQS